MDPGNSAIVSIKRLGEAFPADVFAVALVAVSDDAD